MESNLTDSILRICRTLNTFSVEYMIVGGAAVALHGYYRHSMNRAGEKAEKPNYDDLTLDKKVNARSKDITDLEQLDVSRKKKK